MDKARLEAIKDTVAPLKRGKWIAASLRPWTGEAGREVFEQMRMAVETRGNQAVDEAVEAVAAIIDDARRAAYEEAIKAIETARDHRENRQLYVMLGPRAIPIVASYAIDAIRALANPAPKTDGGKDTP